MSHTTPASSGGALRAGVPVAVSTLVSNVANGLFHVALIRILSGDEYGTLAAMVAAATVLGLPLSALRVEAARRVVADPGLADRLRKEAWRLGIAVAGVGVAIGALVGLVAGVGPGSRVGAVLLVTAPTLAFAIASGVAQGQERFGVFGTAQAVIAGIKLAGALALALAGAGPVWIILLIAAATAGTTRWTWQALQTGLADRGTSLFDRAVVGAAVVLCLSAALAGIDVLVAGLALEGDARGAYAAATFLARTLLLLPFVAMTVLLPRIARDADPQDLRNALIAVGSACAVGAAVMVVLRVPLAELALGDKAGDAIPVIPALAIHAVVLAIANVLVWHQVALGRHRIAYALGAGLAAQAIVTGALAPLDRADLVWADLAGGAVALALAVPLLHGRAA